MRVLYVAMTRAKEKLFLVATVKDVEKTLAKWEDASLAADEMLPEYVRARAKGFLDWIGPSVARHGDYAAWQGKQITNGLIDPSSWSFETVYVEQMKNEIVGQIVPSPPNKQQEVSEDLLNREISRRFDTRYPFERAITKQSKQSVSELKRLDQLRQLEEPEFFRPAQVEEAMTTAYKRPAFMQRDGKRLSSAEIGTALHTTMQHLDFSMESSIEAIQEFVQQVTDKQLLTVEEAKAVNVQSILAFLQSEMGQRLREASQILREVPFTYGLKDDDGDIQILQGIADCLFQESDGYWVLLDYKTDRVKGVLITDNAVMREMNVRYGLQLSLYKEAIERILRITIKEKILYLFDAEKTLVLEDSL
jgi:ATP-dependent helicase/nuclease subunit A